MGKSHYDVLGVPQSATKQDVKLAFFKLSKETHPDVAPKQGVIDEAISGSNEDRFKRISEAYGVLSDDKARKTYDFELESSAGNVFHRHPSSGGAGGFEYPNNGSHNGPHRPKGSSSTYKFMAFLDGVYKPRNLFLGVVSGLVTVSCIRYALHSDTEEDVNSKTGQTNLVQAWKNPVSGKWEQPAPWDETYKKLRPKLEMVHRDQVKRGGQ